MDTVTLEAGAMRCELRPDLGGCIAGLWFDGVAVLRSARGGDALASARQSANFPLVPFSNRIANAQLHWQGSVHALSPNFAPEPHAMHGIGWQRPWALRAGGSAFASLAFSHRADASWPFAFECVQEFLLSQHGLQVVMTITNRHPRPAPAGLGWHPYFMKRPGSHLAFAARGRWETDTQSLPARRSACEHVDVDGLALDINHCFDGWSGAAVLRDDVLVTRIASSLDRLVVSTNPGKDFIAIEPVSHVSNALGREDAVARGIVELEAGASYTARMNLEVEYTRRP